MQMFIERQLGSGVDVMDVGSPNKSSDDTMILATKARMLAWIDTFLPPEGEKRLDSITCSVTSLRMLSKEHIKEEPGGGGLSADTSDWACIDEELVGSATKPMRVVTKECHTKSSTFTAIVLPVSSSAELEHLFQERFSEVYFAE